MVQKLTIMLQNSAGVIFKLFFSIEFLKKIYWDSAAW
jgi:hypothetical protein